MIGALAITGAAAATAGEEEDRILALVLAHPIRRSRLIAAKAAAIAAVVLIIAFATWIGLIVGVALGGGGITIAHIAALAVQLAFFGFATGAVAIALGAGTGRRSLATGVAAAVAILGWLINSFAPLVARSPGSNTSPRTTTTPAAIHSPAASTSPGVIVLGRHRSAANGSSGSSASNAATSAPRGITRVSLLPAEATVYGLRLLAGRAACSGASADALRVGPGAFRFPRLRCRRMSFLHRSRWTGGGVR